MTKFFNKNKKPYFSPIFQFLGQNFQKPVLSHKTSYGFLAPCQNFEKANDSTEIAEAAAT